MSHLASAALLLFSAFMALSLGMNRHYRHARPRFKQTRTEQFSLACLGWLTLKSAILIIGRAYGLTESLVYGFGLASLVVVPVALVHAYRPELAFPLFGGAWCLGLILWLV